MQRHYVPLFLSLLCPVLAMAQSETCDQAPLIDPGTYTATEIVAGGGASQSDATNADWYAFDPPAEGYMTVSSCGAERDTRVHVHTGSCNGLTLLGSDDDGCPEGYPPGTSLLANIPVTPGNIYFIEWDDRWSAQGFTWQLIFHACPIAVVSFAATDSTLAVDWPPLAPGAGYTLEYGPEGFVQGSGTVLTGTVGGGGHPPVVIGDLPSGTAFDVYVSIDCGGGSVSPFSGPWHGLTTGETVIANDACEGALPITCGSTTAGSTTGAHDDPIATDCGTGISAPGVWYTFSGVSGTVVLSTCADHGYDTKINVYSGACDDLHCVSGNDDGPFCYPGSEVVIDADPALTYVVLVQGYNGDTGPFSLAMDCPACAPPTGIFATPADQEALLYWNSGNPGATYTVEYGPAGFAPGTGTVVTGVVGVDGPPALISGLDPSTQYDAYVVEDCGAGGTSYLRGPVGFSTLDHALADNAFCADATEISCGQSVEGNTTDGILTPGPTCGPADITAPGLWYTFTGTGDDVTLSTCDQASFDTKISVFSGTCASLACAGGNDDGTGCGAYTSSVTIPTENGTTYRVLVHGYQENTGTFTLSMTCAAPCSPAVTNDDCAAATAILPQPVGGCVPLTATNTCAYGSPLPNPPCDPYGVISDVWFSLNTGPSPDHHITVASVTAAPLRVAVYTDCDDPAYIDCYNAADGPIDLTGLDLNTAYLIRVWNGGGNEAGTFTICDEAPIITGIQEAVTGDLRVWPVPASESITVEGLPAGTRAMRLLDMQGRLVLQHGVLAAGQQHLSIAGLAPGAYVLRTDGAEPRSVSVVVR